MINPNNSIAANLAVEERDAVELVYSYPTVPLTVDCVIFGFTENSLKVLLIKSDLAKYEGKLSLLGDKVNADEDLDTAAVRVLRQRTGMSDVFLEQVHTFRKPDRHPGGRVVTTVYASLLNTKHHQLLLHDNELKWHNVNQIMEMAFDHKQILEVCTIWLKKRIQEQPLAFNLLPVKFSLRQLQNVYEAILDVKLDRRNFRKKFASMGFLNDTDEMETHVTHRPGKLNTFDFVQYQQKKKSFIGIDF
jgi:8-oxo-dGTP diphosphatase